MDSPGKRNAQMDEGDREWREYRAANTWPEAMPLRRDMQPAEEYPLDALGPALSDVARCIAESVQVPTALAGQSVLAGATLAAQALADMQIDSRAFPLSNYFVTVAESGDRKSAVDRLALAPHGIREQRLRELYVDEMSDWRIVHLAWEKARSQATGGSVKGQQAMVAALREVGDEPAEPIDPVLTMHEPTYEGAVKLLAGGWPSIGLYTGEGGQFLGGHAMSSDNRLKTAAGLSTFWDGDTIRRTRAGDGNTVLYGRRVSMHLMIQPVLSSELFGDDMLAGQGLLGRILAVHPQTLKGTRNYQPTDVRDTAAFKAYFSRISTLLEIPLPLKDGTRNELEPRSLRLSESAKQAWVKFHNHVEAEQRTNGPLRPITSLASKAAEHAARLAGVLALVRDADVSEITAEDMTCGIELTDYYLGEALRLHEEGHVDSRVHAAEKVQAWGLSRGGQFATQTLYQLGPHMVRDKKKAEATLKFLEEHGHARQLPKGTVVDGKPRHLAWEVRG